MARKRRVGENIETTGGDGREIIVPVEPEDKDNKNKKAQHQDGFLPGYETAATAFLKEGAYPTKVYVGANEAITDEDRAIVKQTLQHALTAAATFLDFITQQAAKVELIAGKHGYSRAANYIHMIEAANVLPEVVKDKFKDTKLATVNKLIMGWSSEDNKTLADVGKLFYDSIYDTSKNKAGIVISQRAEDLVGHLNEIEIKMLFALLAFPEQTLETTSCDLYAIECENEKGIVIHMPLATKYDLERIAGKVEVTGVTTIDTQISTEPTPTLDPNEDPKENRRIMREAILNARSERSTITIKPINNMLSLREALINKYVDFALHPEKHGKNKPKSR